MSRPSSWSSPWRFALLAAASLGAVGCRVPTGQPARVGTEGAAIQSGSDPAASSPAQAGVSADQRLGVLRLTIRWPERDRPGFRAQVIPTTTSALVVRVWSGHPSAGVEIGSPIVLQRPSGDATVSKELPIPEGRNYSVQAKAYREASPDLSSAVPIAQGMAAGVGVFWGQTTNAPIVLDAMTVPALSGFDTNLGVPGDTLTLSGANFDVVSGATLSVTFDQATASDLTLVSSTSLRVVVPAEATSGRVTVTNDGVPSTSNANFWVLSGFRLDASQEFWDPSPAGKRIVLVGQTLPFYGIATAFAQRLGADLSGLGASPSATMSVTASLDNGAAGSVSTGDVFTAAASPATASLSAHIGGLSGAGPLSLSVEDLEVTLAPATADISPWDLPYASLYATTSLTSGLQLVNNNNIHYVNFESSDPATLSIVSDSVQAVEGAHGTVSVTCRSILLPARTAAATLRVGIAWVQALAGDGTPAFLDGTGTAAKLNNPSGVAVDATGDVYVADTGNNRIRMINPLGVVMTVAGDGTAAFLDGTGTAAKFSGPSGVAVDAAGYVYVADTVNQRIRKIAPGGAVTTLAGDSSAGFVDGAGTAARFNFPKGVAVDAAGNVYVADTGNNRVRKIAPGGTVTTLAGDGTAAFVDGTGTAARFNAPSGVAVDVAGSVYVADTYNHRVRKVSPSGVVTTLAGNGTGAFLDGTGTAAELYYPNGVAVDVAGAVYVADKGNNRIRRIDPQGVVTALAGNGTAAFLDGAGTGAKLSGPYGVAAGAIGDIYVADHGNHRIRRIFRLF